MTEKEFQDKHGFDTETTANIKKICQLYKGKIVKIEGRKENGK